MVFLGENTLAYFYIFFSDEEKSFITSTKVVRIIKLSFPSLMKPLGAGEAFPA
jgi:hypothetical protein